MEIILVKTQISFFTMKFTSIVILGKICSAARQVACFTGLSEQSGKWRKENLLLTVRSLTQWLYYVGQSIATYITKRFLARTLSASLPADLCCAPSYAFYKLIS
jgi:hypothetical protein